MVTFTTVFTLAILIFLSSHDPGSPLPHLTREHAPVDAHSVLRTCIRVNISFVSLTKTASLTADGQSSTKPCTPQILLRRRNSSRICQFVDRLHHSNCPAPRLPSQRSLSLNSGSLYPRERVAPLVDLCAH